MQTSEQDLGVAFSQLQKSLRSFLRRRLPDPARADDLLQDIFVKALTAQRQGRRIDNLTAWLYTTARTTLIDHYRSNKSQPVPVDEQLVVEIPEDLQFHRELAACMRPFINQLAPLYRDTLVATDLGNETMHSLAQREGVSVSAIKSRAVRARAKLQEKVLACCRVEWAGGLVSDYQPAAKKSCSCSR
jgi:RNA polymerase sigma-70 factor (ECF subfamily)